MKKKFNIFFICVALLMSFVLTACSEDEEIEDNGEIYVDKEWEMYSTEHDFTRPVEIDFWSANSAVDIQGSTMADMVQHFNQYQRERYPDNYIKVNVSFQGGYGVQNTKLQASLVGKTNPEMAMVGVSSFSIYVDNIIDMRNILTYDQIRDIYEGFLQFAMYKNKFVGYPYFAATNVFVVNRTMAQATGMKVPTVDEIIADPENSIWTWAYLLELATKISKQTEEDIYGIASSGPSLYELMFSQDTAIYNPNATKINFDNEAGLKALQYSRDLVTSGAMLNPTLDPNHGTKIQGKFAENKVGLLWGSSSIIKGLHENIVENQLEQGLDPIFEMDVLPFPKDKSFYSNQSGGGIVLFNNKSDVKTKAAVEFFRWLQSPEQVAHYSINTGYLASTKAATKTEAFIDYSEINPLLNRSISLMKFVPKGDLRLPIGRAKALADDDFSKYIKGIYYDDCKRDINGVLKECAERIQYILETNSW